MMNNEEQASAGPALDLAISINDLVEGIPSWAAQVCQQVIPVIANMYSVIYEKYREVGAPYGETQEGCLRWMEELSQVRHYEMEIERIISQHEGLAYLR